MDLLGTTDVVCDQAHRQHLQPFSALHLTTHCDVTFTLEESFFFCNLLLYFSVTWIGLEQVLNAVNIQNVLHV